MGGTFICNEPLLPILSLTYKGLQSRLNINNKSAFHGNKFALSCERHDTMDRGLSCHVGIHVDLSSMILSWGPYVVTFSCEVNLDGVSLFDQRETIGPLHTPGKSRDHEIVGAQKKVSKGRPKTPPTSCLAITDPQV